MPIKLDERETERCGPATKTGLNVYARNVSSQYGEDGIIEKALELIGACNGWAVEFGAADGKYCSNTRNLIEAKGYSTVLIEADQALFLDLARTYESNAKVIPVNALVGFENHNGLDQLLKPFPIPLDFDLLSIDVDGNDYHCWKAVNFYRPKIVVIEFNPTIPNSVVFIQSPDMHVSQGSSISAIDALAKSKGYELIATTFANAVFVDRKYYNLFGVEDNSVGVLRTDASAITHLFSGYDGTIFIAGCGMLPWHILPYNASSMQQLPKCLRQYPGHYGKVKKIIVWAYRRLRLKKVRASLAGQGIGRLLEIT